MAVLEETFDYKSMDYIPGEIIYPGICDVMYFISRSNIVKWPTRDISKSEGRGKYTGNFTLVEGKKWQVLRATYDGAEHTYEDQGTKPGKSVLNHLPVPYPKADEVACENIATMMNDDVVVLFKDRQGKWHVMGCEDFPSEVKLSGGSGKGITGEGGLKVEFTASDVCPCPIYEGEVALAEGTLNLSTGETAPLAP